MKILKIWLAVTLLTASILAFPVTQWARAAEEKGGAAVEMEGASGAVHKLEAGIAEEREKIIAETKAIKEDRRKIKEAGRLSDKTSAVKIKDEATQDIKAREAVIKDLKLSIRSKKAQRSDLLYGKNRKMEKKRTGTQ